MNQSLILGFAVKKTAYISICAALLVFGAYLIDIAVCTGTLTVVVNSPQNKVYTSSNIVVSISASDPNVQTGPDSVAYSLDGGPQVIIGTAPHLGMHSLDGTAELSLPNGMHSIVGIGITWFNGTTDGIYYSAPVYFTIDSPTNYVPTPTPSASPKPTTTPPSPSTTPEATSKPETFPASLVFVASVGIALAVIGLFVYYKNAKRREFVKKP